MNELSEMTPRHRLDASADRILERLVRQYEGFLTTVQRLIAELMDRDLRRSRLQQAAERGVISTTAGRTDFDRRAVQLTETSRLDADRHVSILRPGGRVGPGLPAR